MPPILYYHPSNASMSAHMLLEELGEPFDLRLVDREAREHKSPEYLALNPNGVIPVFIDGDLVLYESAAICLHLAHCDPHRRFIPPPGTPASAHHYKWMLWLASMLHPTITNFFYPERWVPEGDAEAAATVKRLAQEKATALLGLLDDDLRTKGGPWLLGDTITAADFHALMLCRWTRSFTKPARAFPHIGPYLQRLLARPAVRRVYEREGLTDPWV